MIEKQTLKFLSELKEHNVKEWFDANRKRYDAAKENVNSVFEELIKEIGKFDKDIAALQLKDCTYRINRDVRFSKDKTPYKNNIAAYFAKGGKKTDASGYYLHIEPGGAFIGAGCWWPHTKLLAATRQEIDYNFKDWQKILTEKQFKKVFGDGVLKIHTLQRAPKGYEESNPAIEFIKLKSFNVIQKFPDGEMMQKGFAKNTAAKFKTVKPMVDFLNNAVHETE